MHSIFVFSCTLLVLLVLFVCHHVVLGASSWAIATRETCQAKCESCSEGSTTDDLICGSDGVTYLNPCELKCAVVHCNSTLTALHDGICADPVSDVYTSPANASVDQSQTQEINQAPVGSAICDPFEDCTCNLDLLFVCGSDHQTYPNECALKCATRCNADLKIVHYGGCYY